MKLLPYELGQEKMISELIWSVFEKYEAPDYPEKGIATFQAFIAADHLQELVCNSDFRIYCCFEDQQLLGVVAWRHPSHISLLFVREDHHRQGIAKALLNKVLSEILATGKKITEITVNSSPYAVDIYKRMGFVATAELQEQDGILFIPMAKRI